MGSTWMDCSYVGPTDLIYMCFATPRVSIYCFLRVAAARCAKIINAGRSVWPGFTWKTRHRLITKQISRALLLSTCTQIPRVQTLVRLWLTKILVKTEKTFSGSQLLKTWAAQDYAEFQNFTSRGGCSTLKLIIC